MGGCQCRIFIAGSQSKVATARGLDAKGAASRLGEVPQPDRASEDDLYFATDWLYGKQGRIETELSARQLRGGSLDLYDVTPTNFADRNCPPSGTWAQSGRQFGQAPEGHRPPVCTRWVASGGGGVQRQLRRLSGLGRTDGKGPGALWH